MSALQHGLCGFVVLNGMMVQRLDLAFILGLMIITGRILTISGSLNPLE